MARRDRSQPCSLPYSFKLLHAPVVDAVFSSRFGRRKSWIVPIQMVMGSLMIWMGNNTPVLIETVRLSEDIHLGCLTGLVLGPPSSELPHITLRTVDLVSSHPRYGRVSPEIPNVLTTELHFRRRRRR